MPAALRDTPASALCCKARAMLGRLIRGKMMRPECGGVSPHVITALLLIQVTLGPNAQAQAIERAALHPRRCCELVLRQPALKLLR
jgi:hypothetical protein